MPREPTPPRGRIACEPPVEEVSWLAAAYFPRLPGQSPVAGAGTRLMVKGERNSAHPLASSALRLAASCGSRAGYPGVASLDIIGNVLPFIKSEEEKMNSEGRKILGDFKGGKFVDSPVTIMASCARVHVRDGNLEDVFIRHDKMPSEKDIVKALEEFRGRAQALNLPSAPEAPVIVMKEPNRPQPLLDCDAGTPDRARGMAVTIGRVRVERNHLRFYLLSHNTIRGGAGGSVLNAELAHKEGVI